MSNPSVSFILVCEGTSDAPLVGHLETLLIRAGASEAFGTANTRKGTVEDRLRALVDENLNIDLVFVHRDADGSDPRARLREIDQAATALGGAIPCIPVVPIQETEAWLLTDEKAIREVVGRPHGTLALDLPKLAHIERTSCPKEVLARALATASEKSGRRLQEEKAAFDHRRAVLLQRLDMQGDIRQLTAWQALVEAIERVARELHWTA